MLDGLHHLPVLRLFVLEGLAHVTQGPTRQPTQLLHTPQQQKDTHTSAPPVIAQEGECTR